MVERVGIVVGCCSDRLRGVSERGVLRRLKVRMRLKLVVRRRMRIFHVDIVTRFEFLTLLPPYWYPSWSFGSM